MQNLKKMTLEHRVFERMDIILIKYGHDNREFFLEKERFVNNIFAREQWFFSEKSEQTGILIFLSIINIV